MFAGQYEGDIHMNPEEVMAVRYLSVPAIAESMDTEPGLYTAWFRIAFPKIRDWWQAQYAA